MSLCRFRTIHVFLFNKVKEFIIIYYINFIFTSSFLFLLHTAIATFPTVGVGVVVVDDRSMA